MVKFLHKCNLMRFCVFKLKAANVNRFSKKIKIQGKMLRRRLAKHFTLKIICLVIDIAGFKP